MNDPYDVSPACWSWEPPTDADRERVRAKWAPILTRRLTDELLASFVMSDRHQGSVRRLRRPGARI